MYVRCMDVIKETENNHKTTLFDYLCEKFYDHSAEKKFRKEIGALEKCVEYSRYMKTMSRDEPYIIKLEKSKIDILNRIKGIHKGYGERIPSVEYIKTLNELLGEYGELSEFERRTFDKKYFEILEKIYE